MFKGCQGVGLFKWALSCTLSSKIINNSFIYAGLGRYENKKEVELGKGPKREEGDFGYSSCKTDNNAHLGPFLIPPESLS